MYRTPPPSSLKAKPGTKCCERLTKYIGMETFAVCRPQIIYDKQIDWLYKKIIYSPPPLNQLLQSNAIKSIIAIKTKKNNYISGICAWISENRKRAFNDEYSYKRLEKAVSQAIEHIQNQQNSNISDINDTNIKWHLLSHSWDCYWDVEWWHS